MRPMLGHPFNPKKLTYPSSAQRKLNGVRALYQNGTFYSRDEIAWAPGVLEHLAQPLRDIINPAYYPLDGELFVHGWSLQQINSAVAVKQRAPGPRTHLVEYHIFDIVKFNTPFLDRYAPIYNLLESIKSQTALRNVPVESVHSESDANRIYLSHVNEQHEGTIYRVGECRYTQPKVGADQDNRTYNLLKRKDWHDDEFTIVGVVEGRVTAKGSKYVGALGAILCDLGDGRTFRVGSGFSDEQRKDWWLNPPIGQIATVKYLILSDEGIPLNPTFLTLRDRV